MIEIRINPARVEKVLFQSTSDLEEDFDLAAWKLIRPLVAQIDRRLRRAAKGLLEATRPTAEERVRR